MESKDQESIEDILKKIEKSAPTEVDELQKQVDAIFKQIKKDARTDITTAEGFLLVSVHHGNIRAVNCMGLLTNIEQMGLAYYLSDLLVPAILEYLPGVAAIDQSPNIEDDDDDNE
jgi:hypothetical protein